MPGILYDSSQNPANPVPANEILSPVYAWSNTFDKLPNFGTTQMSTDTNRVIRFRDYYIENIGSSRLKLVEFLPSTEQQLLYVPEG